MIPIVTAPVGHTIALATTEGCLTEVAIRGESPMRIISPLEWKMSRITLGSRSRLCFLRNDKRGCRIVYYKLGDV